VSTAAWNGISRRGREVKTRRARDGERRTGPPRACTDRHPGASHVCPADACGGRAWHGAEADTLPTVGEVRRGDRRSSVRYGKGIRWVNRRQQSAVPGREVCGKRRDSGSLLQRCSTARNVSTCGGRSVDLRGASPVHVCVRPCVGGRIQDPGWGQFTAARSEARTGQERAQRASANPIPHPSPVHRCRQRRNFCEVGGNFTAKSASADVGRTTNEPTPFPTYEYSAGVLCSPPSVLFLPAVT
jgi:hypothetical protein